MSDARPVRRAVNQLHAIWPQYLTGDDEANCETVVELLRLVADRMADDRTHETPPDTPSLDTTFHDIEMDID